ncbi:hypothetical protein [Ehrlichia ruminantium]|uniref:hypothetical protein n=1 Tax=Ehrlichia ruminantium TaxID=779 RepID=UPI00130DDD9D|nr:hypothetical protein [Ehrlichia ruminantium]
MKCLLSLHNEKEKLKILITILTVWNFTNKLNYVHHNFTINTIVTLIPYSYRGSNSICIAKNSVMCHETPHDLFSTANI